MTRWRRTKSAIFYQLIRRGIGLLPLRRYSVAKGLMSYRRLKPAVIRVRRGKWVVIPDAPPTWVFPFGLKEPAIQHHLGRLLDRADAFIDCGANLGWYSFLASRKPHIRQIVAVEPIRQSVRYLEFIKRLNGIQHLQILNGCVSNHDGKVNLALHPGAFSEMSYVVESDESPEGQPLLSSVAYTLESIFRMLVPSFNRICLKIDVEGHEERVLASISPQTLATRVDSIIVEVHRYRLSQLGEAFQRMCSVVAAVGPLRFFVSSHAVHPGYRRFWRHLTKRFPLPQCSPEALSELAQRYSVPEVYLLAWRDSLP